MQETCKMNSGIKVDRISVLPKNIIDSILSRLKIKQAVRTSILSRSWRYQWHSIPKIIINYNDLPISHAACVNMIDHILVNHCGSVDKFDLDISLAMDNDIDRWILYLSKNGIKELILNNRYGNLRNNIPSCLFSCSDLTYLELIRCIFKPPPASFKAFCNLTELCFRQVTINDKVLENLVNSCPLLSKLSLLAVDQCSSVKINAPNLTMFRTREVYCYFQFKNTPLLAFVSFGLDSRAFSHSTNNKDCKIVELLGSMPILQRLEFGKHALQHLAVGDVPAHLPLVCPIKHLTVCINFEDLQELLAAFCIFRSSPFIGVLDLTISSNDDAWRKSSDGFWEGEHDFSFRFDHLEEVDVTDFSGSVTELKFIEFVLANAPALKTMVIGFRDYFTGVDDVLSTLDELVRFPRISPKAEVKVYRD